MNDWGKVFWRKLSGVLCAFLLLSSSIHAQTNSAQIQFGSLFGSLTQDTLTSTATNSSGQVVHVPYSAPWAVVQQLVDRQLTAYEQRGASSVTGFSTFQGKARFQLFDTPMKVISFINDLRSQAISITTHRLTDSGVPMKVAVAISERMPRRYLFNLEKALLSYADNPKVTEAKVALAVGQALRQSSTPLLRRDIDFKATGNDIRAKLGYSKASTIPRLRFLNVAEMEQQAPANRTLDQVFDEATRPPDLTGVHDLVVKCLNEKAIEKFNTLKAEDAQYALQGLTRDILARASGQVIVPTIRKDLNVENAFDVLEKVGQFQQVERDTARRVREGGENLRKGLDALNSVMDSNWSNLKESASQITTRKDFSPPYIPQVANTLHIMNDLQTLTAGGSLDANSLTELSGLAAANIPGAAPLLNLVPSLNTLTDAQASFAQKGGALLSGLVGLTGGPEQSPLKEVASAFSTVSSVMQAAGPLLALAGFASPFGGVALVGGLLGGGGPLGGGDSGTAAALAAISKKLEEIDRKLDVVIGKLDKLDQKISQQHVEVMNALESISFDVNRTLTGANQAQVEHYSSNCMQIEKIFQAADAPVGSGAENYKSYFSDCQNDLKTLNDGATKEFLKAIANLSTEDLKKTARDKLALIVAQHSKSQETSANNCFGLVMASSSVHDVADFGGVGMAQATSDQEKSLCSAVLSVGEMLDPGLLSLFSRLEWSSAYYSSRLNPPTAVDLMWKASSRERLERRWAEELKLINAAIGQQALLSGDVTLPNWAHRLNLEVPLDQTDAQVLDQNAILARNSVSFWLDNHLQATRTLSAQLVAEPSDGSQASQQTDSTVKTPLQPMHASDEFASALQYGASYYACSPNYLRSLVEVGTDSYAVVYTNFDKTKFEWTKSVRDQTQSAKALEIDDSNKIPEPCPTRQQSPRRWCAQFEGLSNCIDLPLPDEIVNGELWRGDNLEAVLAARNQLLTLLETTDLIATYKDRLTLMGALAITWRQQKARENQGKEDEGRSLVATKLGRNLHSPSFGELLSSNGQGR